ncbi:30S ribosomal protein S6, partial [Patescibacteria group bacterium]
MNPTKEDTAAPQDQALEEELTKYELMMIFKPDISQEETEKELNKIRKEITKNKGEIYHEDIWDVRDLAYMIKKYDKGYYVIFYFTLDGAHLKEMEKEFLLNAKILRHLFVKSPKNYEIKKLEELMAPSEERKPQEAKDAKPKRKAPVKKVAKKEEEVKEV